ncbi:MAG TPA: hypothetical protein VGM94_12855 [Galbitalea sp.]
MTASDEIPLPEVVTDEHVRDAEREAAEAAALVSALEEAVQSGDENVTPEQITAQEGLSRFARLRAEATRRKAAKSKEAIRLVAANKLRQEIEAYSTGIGPRLATQLRAVADAEAAFIATADEHDQKIRTWRKQMLELQIPESTGTPVPPAEHGHLALVKSDVGIHAGRRRLDLIRGKDRIEHHRNSPGNRESMYAGLAKVDVEAPMPAGQHYYRGAGGAVFTYDVERTPEEIKTTGLVKISQREAWGE